MNRNITAIILIILAAGIYFTVTQSMWDGAKQVKAVNDQYLSAIANAARLVSVRDKVLQDYNNIAQADRDRLDKMLPSTVDNIRLIIDLNNIAVQHSLNLKGIRAVANASASSGSAASTPTLAKGSSGISAPTLDTVDITFSVTAPYQQFLSFLQDLEADLRIMDIKHLSVGVADDGSYTFNVTMKTYWLRQ
jgi:Tfp pilus assembly protein PilO